MSTVFRLAGFDMKTISFKQDDNDVNICLDGKLVAWFDADDSTFNIHHANLRLAGLTLTNHAIAVLNWDEPMIDR